MKNKYKSIALSFLTVLFLSSCMIHSINESDENTDQIDIVSEADMDSDSVDEVGNVDSLLEPEDDFEKLTDFITYKELPDESDYRSVHLLNSEIYDIGDTVKDFKDNGWNVTDIEYTNADLKGDGLSFLELRKDFEVIGLVCKSYEPFTRIEDYEILGFGFEKDLVSKARIGIYRLNEKLSDLNNETILMKNDDTVLMLSTDEDKINNLFVYDRSLIE